MRNWLFAVAVREGKTVAVPPIQSPPMRLRRLARELGAARRKAKLAQADVTARLGWNSSKISRLENGRSYPTIAEVTALLELYGTSTATRAALIELARQVKKRGWWASYGDIFTGSYMDAEDAAVEIREWENQLVPGLLQTPAYARTVFNAIWPDEDEDAIDQRVRARMARKALLDRENAPHLHAILDEAVFRRAAAHSDVMAGQVRALTDHHANVTLQVLPFDRGLHGGIEGAFVIMSFPESEDDDGQWTDPDIAYIAGAAGEQYVESAEEVNRCNLTFSRIADAALTPKRTSTWLARHLKEYR
ncbi:MAG TPA: helix-turn-helix transcriptional regulator [Streptosporangiaceae bacterium]